jgi:hypothetical protein
MGMFLKQNIINKVVEFNSIHKQLNAEQLSTVAENIGIISEVVPAQALVIDGNTVVTPIVKVATKHSNVDVKEVDGVPYEVLVEDIVALVLINNALAWVTRSCESYFLPDGEDVAFTKNDVISQVDIATLRGYKL